MRPKQRETSKSDDLFRARLDQIIKPKHEPVRLEAKIDWTWIDREIAPLYSEHGRPAMPTRFMIGLLLLKSTPTPYRTKRGASVGSRTLLPVLLPPKSSSSTPSRTRARG
jgi:hypothetical protein